MRNSDRYDVRWAGVVLALMLGGCGSLGGPAPEGSLSASPSVSPGPLAPSYPDVTKGNVATAAELLAYDPVAQSAVIEPTLFLTGPDFCKTLHIKASDDRCNRDWVAEDSHVKITLPVGSQARLLTTRQGDEACIGTMASGGTCPVTPKQFAALARENPPLLVHVSVRNGTLTKIAQEFTP
ncbi:MAG: hypothetical protein QOE51_3118 [Actinoplanes sp.]|jgi:hypothetical protein|nr:hypothetical protein [Actinoplanes sp.]